MNVEIVEGSTAHLDQLATLFDGYRSFYEQSSDVDAARAFLLDRLERSESVIFLALGDGEPVGFTQLYPTFSSVSMKRLWILNDLYVAPAGRRQGVGERLIDAARDLAVDTNAKGVILETAADNVQAQALYEKYGFAKDTEFYRYGLLV